MRYAVLIFALVIAPLIAKPTRFVSADSVQPPSAWQLAAVDFLLPGYGTLRQNELGYAALYFSGNLVNLSLVYLAWRNWQFYDSAYAAAAARQATEPDPLLFSDPAGGGDNLSLQDIRNRAERGQLFFTVAIVMNIALRFLSAAHTWHLADVARERAGPRYEFYPDTGGGFQARGGYYWRF